MTRVFIYGSCVSRDAEPWFKDYGFELAGYSARQSLISAFRKADISEYELSGISSSFQRRMTRGDIQGNLRFAIRKAEPDVILWDLCDERLGVRKASTGGMITQSRDHVAEGVHPGPFGRLHRFGENQHFNLWERGLQEFQASLDRLGLKDRLYLNATPWAIQDEFGDDHNGQAAIAEAFNRNSERYLDLAWRKGVNVVAVPQMDAISRTHGHKWGPAPYHYVDGTYLSMLGHFQAALNPST